MGPENGLTEKRQIGVKTERSSVKVRRERAEDRQWIVETWLEEEKFGGKDVALRRDK